MFDEKSFIQILMAVGSGVVAAIVSHVNLRGRVNGLQAASDVAAEERREFRRNMLEMKEDVAFIRGKMEGGQ